MGSPVAYDFANELAEQDAREPHSNAYAELTVLSALRNPEGTRLTRLVVS